MPPPDSTSSSAVSSVADFAVACAARGRLSASALRQVEAEALRQRACLARGFFFGAPISAALWAALIALAIR
jgi:hypothetical protein